MEIATILGKIKQDQKLNLPTNLPLDVEDLNRLLISLKFREENFIQVLDFLNKPRKVLEAYSHQALFNLRKFLESTEKERRVKEDCILKKYLGCRSLELKTKKLFTKLLAKVEQLSTCSKHKLIELNLSESIRGASEAYSRFEENLQKLIERPLIDVGVILTTIIKASRMRFQKEFEKVCQLIVELSLAALEQGSKIGDVRLSGVNTNKEKRNFSIETPRHSQSDLKLFTTKPNILSSSNLESVGSPRESLLEKLKRMKSNQGSEQETSGKATGEKESVLNRLELMNHRLSGKKLENISTGVTSTPELTSRFQADTARSSVKENLHQAALTERVLNTRQENCEDKPVSYDFNIVSSRFITSPFRFKSLKRENAAAGESNLLSKGAHFPQLKEGDTNGSNELNKNSYTSTNNLFKVHMVKNSYVSEEKNLSSSLMGSMSPSGKVFSSELWKIYELLAIDGLPLVIAHRPDHKQAQMNKVYNEMLACNGDIKKVRDRYLNQHKAYVKRYKSQHGHVPLVQTAYSSSHSLTNLSGKARTGNTHKSLTIAPKSIYVNLQNSSEGMDSTRNYHTQLKINSANKQLNPTTSSKSTASSDNVAKFHSIRPESNRTLEQKRNTYEPKHIEQFQKVFELPKTNSENLMIGSLAE